MVLYSYAPIAEGRSPLPPTLEDYAKTSAPKNADARRAALSLLAELSATSGLPVAFPVGTDENGRPHFDGVGAPDFNLSHSGGLAAAVLGTCRVGIDIQEELPSLDTAKLAARFFGKNEQARLQGAPRHLFFELWTKKEALGKLLGQGLSPLLGKDTDEIAKEYGVFFVTERLSLDHTTYTLTVCATETIN